MNSDDASNPYTAPESNVADARVVTEGEKQKLFSPRQGETGTFFFGPLAGLYILQANFAATGDHLLRSKTIQYGALAVVVFSLLTPFVPEKIPGVVLGLMYMMLTRAVMDKYQHRKDAIAISERYCFQSNWLVFGVGMACLMIYFVVLAAIAVLYSVLGFIEPLW
jgi:hypothetical protein